MSAERVTQLLQVGGELRDRAWFHSFAQCLRDAAVFVDQPQFVQGPDGYPYQQARLASPSRRAPRSMACLRSCRAA